MLSHNQHPLANKLTVRALSGKVHALFLKRIELALRGVVQRSSSYGEQSERACFRKEKYFPGYVLVNLDDAACSHQCTQAASGGWCERKQGSHCSAWFECLPSQRVHRWKSLISPNHNNLNCGWLGEGTMEVYWKGGELYSPPHSEPT